MEVHSSKFLSRSLAIIMTIVFIAIIIMISLTFIKPNNQTNSLSKEINYSNEDIWKAVYHKSYYLNSKKEILSYKIYDTMLPRWVEFYSPSDSVENITKKFIEKKFIVYTIINKKYEEVHGIAIILDSIGINKTKVQISENSVYFNSWAGVYFTLIHPNTVLDYEFVKLNNSLKYIDSVSKK